MKKLLLGLCGVLSFAAASAASPKGTLITVETKNTMLVYRVNDDGRVLFQHWGEKTEDLAPLSNRPFVRQPDTDDDLAPQIYPAYGGRYYLEPALKLTHADGVLTTDLRYENCRVRRLDADRVETVVSLKDRLYELYVDVRFVACYEEDIIAQSVSLWHRERGEVVVERFASSFFPLHAESYYLTHFHGTWASEMQAVEEPLTPGIKQIETKKGVRATQAQNPSFLLSLNAPRSETSGDVYAGSLAWSGNYNISFEVDETLSLQVVGGMNDFAADYRLPARKRLETPEMLLTYSSAGVGPVSRNFHDWARRYGLCHGSELRPIVFNSWEGAYFKYDEGTLHGMIDKAAELGIELFVLDDGWFGNEFPRNSDKAGLGDWQVNRQKLPHGIDSLASYAASRGMRFGIWIEPEMVNPQSVLARSHPEWIVRSGDRELLTMRNQWLLDLCNPEVQDFVFDVFDRVVSLSPKISYVKWDANRHVDNVGSTALSSDKQSHFWYEYVRGLYRVYERIRNKYPDLQIQLCSSGGGRLEYGALRYHDEFWPSDNTNALDRIFIQYGTNLFFPAMATAAHVSPAPNHQTGMVLPLKFRLDVAMSGRLGFELNPASLNGRDFDFIRKALDDYREIRPVVHLGDLYRLASPYGESGWSSNLYVLKDRTRAVLFAYSLRYHARTTYFETKLAGLDSAKMYRIRELNTGGKSRFWGDRQLFSGDYLMKVGIPLDIDGAYESVVLLLSEEETPDL